MHHDKVEDLTQKELSIRVEEETLREQKAQKLRIGIQHKMGFQVRPAIYDADDNGYLLTK